MSKPNMYAPFSNIFLATFIFSYLNLNWCNFSLMLRQSKTKLGLPFMLYATVKGLITVGFLAISEMHFLTAFFFIFCDKIGIIPCGFLSLE